MVADDSYELVYPRCPRIGGIIHHLKGLSVLLVTAAIVAGAVVGLRALLVTEEVRFGDTADGSSAAEDLVLVAVGGELMVTGEREGPFILARQVTGPSFGLGGDDGRMFFEGQGESLSIKQFAYDGLEFFPKEGECSITPGQVNEAAGVAAVTIECPEIRDVRDKATIALSGIAGIPAGMVAEAAAEGGTVRVGRETWEIESALLDLDPQAIVTGSRYPLVMDDGTNALSFSHVDGELTLEEVLWEGSTAHLEPEECDVATEELMNLSPEVTLIEVTIDCPSVVVPGRPAVEISGTVTVQRFSPPS